MSVDAISVNGGTATIDNNGTPGDPSDDVIVYTPPVEYIVLDRVTYTISDGRGGTATADIFILID